MGVCADGVCCNAGCTTACQTCATGICLPVTNQDDPDTCTGTMTCNGTGSCVTRARLSPATTTVSLNTVEVNVAASGSVTLMNAGGAPTGASTVTNQDPQEIAISSNGCATSVNPNTNCAIAFTFKPMAAGPRSGTFTVSAVPGGTVTVTVTATGAYRLTVVKAGTGTGTVTGPGGIACGSTCSTLLGAGAAITLQARSTNGSNSFFSGYSGGGCMTARDCSFTLNASTTLTATFAAMTNNLIFATAGTFPSNAAASGMPGHIAYDADCNSAATAAGINNVTGTGYVAMISDSTSLAKNRLGTARGWVRMDGAPFADTVTALFTNNVVYNSMRFDETGQVRIAPGFLMTGTLADGSLAAQQSCNDWTDSTGAFSVLVGSPEGGPNHWIDAGDGGGCTTLTRGLICMGNTKTSAVAPVVSAGRKVWLTNAAFTVGGTQTPDQMCQAQKPTGVTTAIALISYNNKTILSSIDPAMNYVRVDGTLVATGAQLPLAGTLASGIWQSADGVYRLIGLGFVWTGGNLNAASTTAATCGNWGDPSQPAGIVGSSSEANSEWWSDIGTTCSTAAPIYCIQTSP